MIELKVLEHRSSQANPESKMNITLHIGNKEYKECGTCIPKDINIEYKMDENHLNVHIRLYLGYGVKNKMSISFAMGISLKPF